MDSPVHSPASGIATTDGDDVQEMMETGVAPEQVMSSSSEELHSAPSASAKRPAIALSSAGSIAEPSQAPAAAGTKHARLAEVAEVLADGVTLTSHQREAYDWFVERGSGVLGDDPGLGKTITTLTILAAAAMRAKKEGRPFRALIVVKPALANYWKTELKNRIRSGILPLCEYEGQAHLPRTFVTFVTYDKVQNDFEEFFPGKEDAAPVASVKRKDVSLALMDSLTGAVLPPAPPTDKIAERIVKARSYAQQDRQKTFGGPYWRNLIDPSTCLTVKPISRRGLFSVEWDYIAMDEAHELRNPHSLRYRASLMLAAKERIWITATLIHNSMMDACAALLWLREPTLANETSEVPPAPERPGEGMRDQEYRAWVVLPQWVIGRSTQTLIDEDPEGLAADPRTRYLVTTKTLVFERAVDFATEEERNFHLGLVRRLRTVAEKLLARGSTTMGTEMEERVARQLGSKKKKKKGETKEEEEEEEEETEDTLLEVYGRAMRSCIAGSLADPTLKGEKWSTKSTKMLALVDEITTRVPKGDKVIVYFKHVEPLRIASAALAAAGVGSVMFHGGISRKDQDANVKLWKTDKRIQVILAQLDVGGVGQNWPEANHVLFPGIWYNPQSELQGIHRPWRPGQTKDVRVVRIVIAGSIEEIVLAMQEKKMRLSETAMRKKRKSVFDPAEVLSDVTRLLEQHDRHSMGREYRPRDTELEYKRALEQRVPFEAPAWVDRSSIATHRAVFLAPHLSYSRGGFVPAGAIVWRISTSADDLRLCSVLRPPAEPKNASLAAVVGAKRKQPTPAAASSTPKQSPLTPQQQHQQQFEVALEIFRLRVLLCRYFYEKLTRWTAAYTLELLMSHDKEAMMEAAVATGPAYATMQRIAQQQMNARGAVSYDIAQLTTPAEVIGTLRSHLSVYLTLHCTEEALLRDRAIYGTYDPETSASAKVDVRGLAAARLYGSSISSGKLRLCPDVLLLFSTAWIDPACRSILQRTCTVPPAPQSDPRSLWTRIQSPKCPASAEGSVVDLSGAFRWRTLQELLVPLMVEAHESDRLCSMATALLVAQLFSNNPSAASVQTLAHYSDAGTLDTIGVAIFTTEGHVIGASVYSALACSAHAETPGYRKLHAILAERIARLPSAKRMFGTLKTLVPKSAGWTETALASGGRPGSVSWGALVDAHHGDFERAV